MKLTGWQRIGIVVSVLWVICTPIYELTVDAFVPWSEVKVAPDFQQLNPEQQEQMRLRYFNEVIAPQISLEEYWAAKQQFDTQSGSKPPVNGGWIEVDPKSIKPAPLDDSDPYAGAPIIKPAQQPKNTGNDPYAGSPIVRKVAQDSNDPFAGDPIVKPASKLPLYMSIFNNLFWLKYRWKKVIFVSVGLVPLGWLTAYFLLGIVRLTQVVIRWVQQGFSYDRQ